MTAVEQTPTLLRLVDTPPIDPRRRVITIGITTSVAMVFVGIAQDFTIGTIVIGLALLWGLVLALNAKVKDFFRSRATAVCILDKKRNELVIDTKGAARQTIPLDSITDTVIESDPGARSEFYRNAVCVGEKRFLLSQLLGSDYDDARGTDVLIRRFLGIVPYEKGAT